MTTKKLVPRASGEGAMGVADNAWGEAYYDTGNFNKGLFVKGSGIEDVIANTVTQGGLGGEWTRNGLDIYYNGGNVGIGTTDPGVFKTVFNNSNADTKVKIASGDDKVAGLFFGEDAGGGDTPAWLLRYGSQHATPGKVALGAVGSGSWVAIQGDSSDVLNIRGDGNVGIGTTSPVTKLDLNEVAGIKDVLQSFSKGGLGKARVGLCGATSQVLADALANDLCIRSDGHNIRFGTAAATRTDMTILSNGHVGIGTTNPGAALDVAGAVHFSKIPCNNDAVPGSTFTGAAMSFQPASGTFGTGKSKDIGIAFRSLHSGTGAGETDLLLGSVNPVGSPQEIMKLFSDGRVRIGRNSSENGQQTQQFYGALLPGGSLEIRAENDLNAASAQLRIVGGSGLGNQTPVTGSLYIDNGGAASTTGKFKISQDIVGGEIHVVSSGGGVKLTSGGTTWVTATSDRRAKENISPLENVLEKVLKLSPSRFDFKEEYGNKDQIGFIAQDVNEVLPEFHIPGETEEEMSTVKFSDTATTALLVKAIQEQQQLIEDLRSEVEALKNK
jgi:hypothetical protein